MHQNEDPSRDIHNHDYHSWGPEGIEFDPILDFFKDLFQNPGAPLYLRDGPFPGIVAVAQNATTPRLWFPKSVLRYRHIRDIIEIRLKEMLPHFQHALEVQLFEHPDQYPALIDVLKKVGSFPLVMDLNDYIGCNRDNYKMLVRGREEVKSLPRLTLSQHIRCQYTFSTPDYESYILAKSLGQNQSWINRFVEWAEAFPPMTEKIPKAFWRGSCTQARPQRKQMYTNLMETNDTHEEYIDFGFTALCAGVTETVPLVRPDESMRYRAVMDIDGNSWSSRFSRLLCYNSVVIRVEIEEDYEAYFMRDVKPGIHYLPASLENFTEVAKWAVQNSSLPYITKIVENANDWCKWKIRTDEMNRDFLGLLNGYINELNKNNTNWILRWKASQKYYLGTDSFHLHNGFVSDFFPNHAKALETNPDMQGLHVAPLPY